MKRFSQCIQCIINVYCVYMHKIFFLNRLVRNMHEESIISHRDVSLWKMLALHHGTSCKRGPERVSPSTNSQIDARLRRYLRRYSQIELGSQGQTPICPNAVSCKRSQCRKENTFVSTFYGVLSPFF